MTKIEKKIDPRYFEMVKQGKKNAEIRLNDFRAEKGDTLLLREYDRKAGKYTGRNLKKKVTNVYTVNPMTWFSCSDIKKNGLLILELERSNKANDASPCSKKKQ